MLTTFLMLLLFIPSSVAFLMLWVIHKEFELETDARGEVYVRRRRSDKNVKVGSVRNALGKTAKLKKPFAAALKNNQDETIPGKESSHKRSKVEDVFKSHQTSTSPQWKGENEEGFIPEITESTEKAEPGFARMQKKQVTKASNSENKIMERLLFSSSIPDNQEMTMRFYSVYGKDSYFMTAYDDVLRIVTLNSMRLLLPLQKTQLYHLLEDLPSERLGQFCFSTDGVYLVLVAIPSNTIRIHRMFHQLAKQPKFLFELNIEFEQRDKLVEIGIQAVSEKYAFLVACSSKELKLWEINLDTSTVETTLSTMLDFGVTKMMVHGHGSVFRTMHPGEKAQGQLLYIAMLSSNGEIVMKSVSVSKGESSRRNLQLSEIFRISQYNNNNIKIADFSINNETAKSSKYLLVGTSSCTLCLYKRSTEKTKSRGRSEGKTFYMKEILSFQLELGDDDELTAVAIATKCHMFIAAVGLDLYFIQYSARNKSAQLIERIPKAHHSIILGIEVSPEERYISTRENSENVMKVWSLANVVNYEKIESVNDTEY